MAMQIPRVVAEQDLIANEAAVRKKIVYFRAFSLILSWNAIIELSLSGRGLNTSLKKNPPLLSIRIMKEKKGERTNLIFYPNRPLLLFEIKVYQYDKYSRRLHAPTCTNMYIHLCL